MKPIEPGCLALIYNVPDEGWNGKIVTVVRKIESSESVGWSELFQGLWWEISGDDLPFEKPYSYWWAIPEPHLMRIDDPDFQANEAEQEKELAHS